MILNDSKHTLVSNIQMWDQSRHSSVISQQIYGSALNITVPKYCYYWTEFYMCTADSDKLQWINHNRPTVAWVWREGGELCPLQNAQYSNKKI